MPGQALVGVERLILVPRRRPSAAGPRAPCPRTSTARAKVRAPQRPGSARSVIVKRRLFDRRGGDGRGGRPVAASTPHATREEARAAAGDERAPREPDERRRHRCSHEDRYYAGSRRLQATPHTVSARAALLKCAAGSICSRTSSHAATAAARGRRARVAARCSTAARPHDDDRPRRALPRHVGRARRATAAPSRATASLDGERRWAEAAAAYDEASAEWSLAARVHPARPHPRVR